MENSEVSYKRLFDLKDRVVVITGANGILGHRYVAAFGEYGAKVVIADVDKSACAEHAASHVKRYGTAALGLDLDVTSPRSISDVIARVESEFGPVDVLVNNAATKGRDAAAFFAPTGDYSLATWREVMAVNLDGLFLVAQAVGSKMAERGSGSIINVSSIYGNVAPDQRIYEGAEYLGRAINTPAVYSASKAGVIGLTRYLAALWGEFGVRVNTLTPGGVQSGQNDTFQTRYGARTPLRRMAQGDEMVGAVIYLASDASSYVTGHNLVVDGGWTIW